MTILDTIAMPSDLARLSRQEMTQLAGELRARIVNTCSVTGGHLAANLGVVEMTLALLRVFHPPDDKILWDVSHQTYAYKLLTGRNDRFCTLRQHDGISGFSKRSESRYDAYCAGHAGTALSAALGMAVARDRRGEPHHVVAVVGDAAAGCGIALEALNNLATTTRRLIVVLNDNEMSISANVGALSRHLGGLLANPRYNRWKRSVENLATRLHMGWLRSAYYRLEEAVKSLFLKSAIFEEMGLRYIGPIDGHNIDAMIDALSIARDSKTPILLHVSTQKGRGYSYAEEWPDKWHGISSFDITSGETLAKSERPSYSQVFGRALERLGEQDERVIAITAAMTHGTGLDGFAARFPDRFFDVGISEEHAVIFAAGLAAEGMVPVFAVYSTFLQRAVDGIIHDVCLQDLPVIFCLDRAGVVGDDGPTHHGVFDIPLLRPIPGLVIMQPKDEPELADMLFTAVRLRRPVALRYPRGAAPGATVGEERTEIPLGRADVLVEGREVQLWALGDMVPVARDAAAQLAREDIAAGVVNARFVRPLDEDLLARQASDAKVIATLENGVLTGGFGSAVEESLVGRGFGGRILRFGWPDAFIPQGPVPVLMESFGLTADAVAHAIQSACHAQRAS